MIFSLERTLTNSMDMDLQHGREQYHRREQQHGYGLEAWTWTYTIDMDMEMQYGHGHAVWVCSMDMQNGYAALQNIHYCHLDIDAAWT
jgi:hypothetical protein